MVVIVLTEAKTVVVISPLPPIGESRRSWMLDVASECGERESVERPKAAKGATMRIGGGWEKRKNGEGAPGLPSPRQILSIRLYWISSCSRFLLTTTLRLSALTAVYAYCPFKAEQF